MIYEMFGIIVNETGLAWLVDAGLDGEVWLPKSLVTFEQDSENRGTFTMPEWLALEKGLA